MKISAVYYTHILFLYRSPLVVFDSPHLFLSAPLAASILRASVFLFSSPAIATFVNTVLSWYY